jgi:hypothetical protein
MQCTALPSLIPQNYPLGYSIIWIHNRFPCRSLELDDDAGGIAKGLAYGSIHFALCEHQLHVNRSSQLRFEAFTAVTMEKAVLWDVMQCGSCKNRRFEGTYLLRHTIVFLRRVRWLLVTANVVPSSPILVTLMMDALCSSETSVLTRVTRRHI